MLVLKWTVIGFFLTMSYKSVLRAILMKTEYEETIDTIDDLILSDRKLMIAADTHIKDWVENDPRGNVQALNLAEQIKYYNVGVSTGVKTVAME